MDQHLRRYPELRRTREAPQAPCGCPRVRARAGTLAALPRGHRGKIRQRLTVRADVRLLGSRGGSAGALYWTFGLETLLTIGERNGTQRRNHPMSKIQDAKDRIEDYVTQLATHPNDRLDILKLQHLENDLIAATRGTET